MVSSVKGGTVSVVSSVVFGEAIRVALLLIWLPVGSAANRAPHTPC